MLEIHLTVLHEDVEVSFFISESLFELYYILVVTVAQALHLFDESLVGSDYFLFVIPDSPICSRVESYLCGVSLAIFYIFGQTDFSFSSFRVFADRVCFHFIWQLGMIFRIFVQLTEHNKVFRDRLFQSCSEG